jgi:predicted DNA-binding transcriptional regulator YafY
MKGELSLREARACLACSAQGAVEKREAALSNPRNFEPRRGVEEESLGGRQKTPGAAVRFAPRPVSRSGRLLELLQVLRRRRSPVRAEAIAGELGVSVRSIYRDVATLRAQGAAIEGEAGVGYILRPGFLLPPLMFSEDELEALILGLRLAHEDGDPTLAKGAVEADAKIRAVLPAQLLADAAPLLAGPRPARAPDRIDLAQVRRDIRAQRKVSIDYLDLRGAATTRIVWPFALAFFERARVILAWCEDRQDYRSFRADRVGAWRALADRAPRTRAALLREWREKNAIPEPEVGDPRS